MNIQRYPWRKLMNIHVNVTGDMNIRVTVTRDV